MLNFGVRSTGARPPPPSDRLMKVRMATEKLFARVLRSKRTRNRSAFDRRTLNGGAKHTLQIHLPRKILYIISSPEICQINSMKRTSKSGTISKKLNVYIVMKMNFRY